jgi:tRNA (cytidine32/uridine32-2'-O)-methyltransferase
MAGENRHLLDRIRVVLVGTTHTGNMGATARAMKAMGLTRLCLVRPKRLPDAESIALASGADDVLAAATVHDALLDALAGCRLVVGSSARRRTVEWPLLEPPECAQTLLQEAAQGDVALVLGRESSGLSNEELELCHYLTRIPADPGFSSLNLAAAAQVFAYEIRQAWSEGLMEGTPESPRDTAPPEVLDGFHRHLTRTLVEIGFANPEQSRKLGRRLRRLFNRARPDRTEINILRGILNAAQGKKDATRFRIT